MFLLGNCMHSTIHTCPHGGNSNRIANVRGVFVILFTLRELPHAGQVTHITAFSEVRNL